MESGFYRFCETSMCMSTASVESTVREGFDASGRSVHTILDLWNIYHKCGESQLLKPLHPTLLSKSSGDARVARLCKQRLDFDPFHSCRDQPGSSETALANAQLARKRLAHVGPSQKRTVRSKPSTGLEIISCAR